MHARRFTNTRQSHIVSSQASSSNIINKQQLINLIIQQKIASISITVNQQSSSIWASSILHIKQAHPQIFTKIAIGLHFNLTSGEPTSQLQLKNDRKFSFELLAKFGQQRLTEQQICDEFDSQVKKFIQTYKRRPSHISSNENIHLMPYVAKSIVKSMCQFGVYKISISQDSAFVSFDDLATAKQIYRHHSVIWAQEYSYNGENMASSQKCHFSKGITPEYINQSSLKQHENTPNSFLDLRAKYQQKPVKRLLIYSKLDKGTGNCTTTLRFKEIFQTIGYEVFTWSVESDIQRNIEVEDLQKFIISFGISLIMGINVTRSARTIHLATCSPNKIRMKVPYILVIAGTDANYTFQDQNKYMEMRQCIYWSQCIVSLSSDMSKITLKILQKLKIEKNVYTIVQSSSLKLCSNLLRQENSILKEKYILFPTSFRRIKCVQHIFNQLNWLIQTYHIRVLIVGPIIEKEYYESIKDGLGKVEYAGTLSQQSYAVKLKDAFALINCSESEGMSCSILQAMQFGIPVIARSNAGNKQLITHSYNGLIYSQPQDFISQFQLMMNNASLRNQFIQNSRKIFQQKYSLKAQIASYQKLVHKQIQQRVLQMKINQKYIRIFNQAYVHQTSEVNNQLYLQIQPIKSDGITILDLGCGTAIFGFIYLLKGQYSRIKLYLVEINTEILGNALFNCRQSSLWSQLEVITICQSDFFNNFDKNIVFDAILFNPPQTPFRNPASRPDKNGGENGIKFYQLILRYFYQSSSQYLYLLHSYMAWPSKLKELLDLYSLKCIWRSEKRVHKIKKQDYDLMESNLADYILKHRELGRADILLNSDIFQIPAQMQLITKQ